MRLGEGRTSSDLYALGEIIERCGRLPLAMAVIAARAAAHGADLLRAIAEEIRGNSATLARCIDGITDVQHAQSRYDESIAGRERALDAAACA